MSFQPIALQEERLYKGKVFPLTLEWRPVMQPSPSILDWFRENKSNVEEYLRDHKAVLFRCADTVPSYIDFSGIIEIIDFASMEYVGGAAVRTQLTKRVFTANESPSSEVIPFHHEMAQTPLPPTHLFFYCEVPPLSGGETPILVSAEVCSKMQLLHPQFMQDLENCGVRYVRYMPEYDDPTSAIGRGWRSTFQATDRAGAEAALLQLGSSWEWQTDGSLKTVTAAVPAIRTDDQPIGAKRSGEKTFFNSVVAAYTGWNDSRNDGSKAVLLGKERAKTELEQGDEKSANHIPVEPQQQQKQQFEQQLDERAIASAVQVMGEVCVAFPWRAGDILLLDNRTVMHARRPFHGPRRILASLARDPER